ncbi:MAG TPA: hypothetical protein V6D12_20085 [Candidatus Obscuribacterales bacterium]
MSFSYFIQRQVHRLFNAKISTLFACLVALTIAACQSSQSQKPRPTPLPQDPLVQVYFNHSEASDYLSPIRKQRRAGDNLEKQIVEAIASAQKTVDIAVQELKLPGVASALVERQQAGVRVRVILENTYSRPWSTSPQLRWRRCLFANAIATMNFGNL